MAIDSVGTAYTLDATSGVLPVSVSGTFDVTAGVPATLEFSGEPTDATAGSFIAPAVTITARDDQGNVATAFTDNVTLSITGGTGTTNATLSGTLTVAAVSGVATLGDLAIDSAGTNYSLDVTSGVLPVSTSAPFDVTPGSATTIVFTQDPSNTTAGQAIAPAVTVAARDNQGNVATGFADNVTDRSKREYRTPVY